MQLQQISSQQMKIQSMRNKLAVFREAAAKEEDMFAQLLLIRRIPAAYHQCLAECMRRYGTSVSFNIYRKFEIWKLILGSSYLAGPCQHHVVPGQCRMR